MAFKNTGSKLSLGRNIGLSGIKGYYIDFTPKVNKVQTNNLLQYTKIYVKKYGLINSYVKAAQSALGFYEMWLDDKDEKYLNMFLRLADWLVKNLIVEGEAAVWKHHFDWHYNIKAPWVSAMSQGEGLSVLLRAFIETKENRFLDSAIIVFNSFKPSIGETYGIVCTEKSDLIFFEEYPSKPSSHVLNGAIFSILGIYDYSIFSGDPLALALFEKSIFSLKCFIKSYDLRFWSQYDLYKWHIPFVANPFYHDLHIKQLKILAHIQKDNYFETIASEWQSYQNNLLNRLRTYSQLSLFKLYSSLYEKIVY